MNPALASALRELLRVGILALIPVFISTVLPELNLPVYANVLITSVLRGVDKYLHELGVATGLEFDFIS